MKKIFYKTTFSLLLIVSLFFLISCELFNTPQTIKESDLEIILNTLSVFEENYYAKPSLETEYNSNPDYIVEKGNEGQISKIWYKGALNSKQIKGFSIPDDFVLKYSHPDTHDIIYLHNWDINDFSLSIAFPSSEPWADFFEDKNVEVEGTFHRDSGTGTTVSATEKDNLVIKVNATNYDIIFSYYYNNSSGIATTSLYINDIDYSNELKEFLETIFSPDNIG